MFPSNLPLVGRSVLLGFCVSALVLPVGALAGYGNYYSGSLGADARDAGATRANLNTSVSSVSSGRVASASAHLAGSWTLVGTYKQASDFVCKEYNGTENYGALVKNIHTVSVNTVAGESYDGNHLCNW